MDVKKIIIHRSESNWGNVKVIDGWHKKRGWDGIGYHYVIENQFPFPINWIERKPNFENDGKIEVGRKFGTRGAHCRGHNHDSVGICIIGMRNFTGKQFASLKYLIKKIHKAYPDAEVLGHYELDSKKDGCPQMNMDNLRDQLEI